MPVRSVPGSASVASESGGKLFAPSAARNAEAIGGLLALLLPGPARVLELASGTGQHAAEFAARFPQARWQPTDTDPARCASIDAYAAEAACPNLAPARQLDATAAGWAAGEDPPDLILLVNLLHLISAAEAKTLITEAARALSPGGHFVIYGPFMRGGALTSAGDQAFHNSLQAHDPAIGYKDLDDVLHWLAEAGLPQTAVAQMPANNLALTASGGES